VEHDLRKRPLVVATKASQLEVIWYCGAKAMEVTEPYSPSMAQLTAPFVDRNSPSDRPSQTSPSLEKLGQAATAPTENETVLPETPSQAVPQVLAESVESHSP
jgi:hypothetical protein